VAFIATGTAMATAALTLLPSASASSHREAPLILGEPAVDNTDVYAFTSPDKGKQDTVTLIGNWQPFSDPEGGPNFYPFEDGAHYDINVDSDGDALPNITYRWIFETQDLRDNTFLYNNGAVTDLDDENLLFRQTYDLLKITDGKDEVLLDDQLSAPSNVGPASMPDYAELVDEATVPVGDGGQTFAGQADDAFFLDLRVFDLLYGGDLSEVGNDTLAGYNTNTLAIQVPKSELALNYDPEANPVIGVWSDTEKRTMKLSPGDQTPVGDHVQVSRLGNPLVNEVISSVPLKDAFNASQPVDDASNDALVDRVLVPEVPILIEAIYGVPAPETPRNDLFEIFLTGITDSTGDEIQVGNLNSQMDNADVDPAEFRPSEMLRLNMSIPVTAEPNRLGVLAGDLQGFPNGRRLADDVVDIELQALEGAVRTGELVEAIAPADSVDANDEPFLESFPYVAVAQNSAVNGVGGDGAAAAPGGFGPGGIGFTSVPVVAGFAALTLLGAGVFLLRRRPEWASLRGSTVPATD